MIAVSSADWVALALSLKVATVATLVTAPIALFLAWVLARKEFAGRALLSALVHLPLVLPPVVTGYLLLIALGPETAAGRVLSAVGVPLAFRWTGAALAAGVMALPLMVRAMRLGFEAVDPHLEDAARVLGASRAAVFATITLPLMGLALVAGLVLGFAKAMGEFGATITFVAAIPGRTQTLPAAIYARLQTPGGEAQALTLAALSAMISIIAVLLVEWLARRGGRV